MSKIENLTTAKPRCILAAMSLALIAGCASSQYGNAEYHTEAQKELRSMSCPRGTTAACVSRIGKAIRCFCGHRGELERILDLEK